MDIKKRTQLGDLMDHFGLVGDAVEIGVAEGRNSEIIISWPSVTKLYLIDSWKYLMNQKGDGGFVQEWHDINYKEALQRTEQYAYKRVVLKGLSIEMIHQIPDNSLQLAYVDGDHSYKGALNDLIAIWPKIKVGGILAGHDYLNPVYGVRQAVIDFCIGKKLEIKDCEINIIPEHEEASAGFWLRKI